MPRPACLVTGTVSPYRREPFRLLAEHADVEVIAFEDAGPPVPGLTVHRTTQAGAVRLAGSGRYRAVISGLGGRVALPGAYLAAQARRIPFVLWATIWAHPRSLAHALSWPATRHLYRNADAVATYGDHVSDYVNAYRGARGKVFVAPQAVDVEAWSQPVAPAERTAARERAGASTDAVLFAFVGRLEREKGVEVLAEAWRRVRADGRLHLAVAGSGPLGDIFDATVARLGTLDEGELRHLYAAADVVVLPSIRTATFREPWGLVTNEAMLQGTPAITSSEVGAAAGGLVMDGRTGLVVPAAEPAALAAAMARIAADPGLRAELGQAARSAALRFTPAAWATGMAAALTAAGKEDDG